MKRRRDWQTERELEAEVEVQGEVDAAVEQKVEDRGRGRGRRFCIVEERGVQGELLPLTPSLMGRRLALTQGEATRFGRLHEGERALTPLRVAALPALDHL